MLIAEAAPTSSKDDYMVTKDGCNYKGQDLWMGDRPVHPEDTDFEYLID